MERKRPRVRRAIFSRTELEPMSTAANVGMRGGQQCTSLRPPGHSELLLPGREDLFGKCAAEIIDGVATKIKKRLEFKPLRLAVLSTDSWRSPGGAWQSSACLEPAPAPRPRDGISPPSRSAIRSVAEIAGPRPRLRQQIAAASASRANRPEHLECASSRR